MCCVIARVYHSLNVISICDQALSVAKVALCDLAQSDWDNLTEMALLGYEHSWIIQAVISIVRNIIPQRCQTCHV